MRLSLLLAAIMVFAIPGFAHAINEQNQNLLEEYFKGKGTVEYETYTPLGGPEIGGAVLRSTPESPQVEILICRVAQKNIESMFVQSARHEGTRPAFQFMLTGHHLLTYPTSEWTDPQGKLHQRGDIKIYELPDSGEPKLIFEMRDVLNASIGRLGPSPLVSLVWQPEPHFLNREGVLPVKYSYNRLVFNEASGKYELYQHLQSMNDAVSVEAANLNNRAIFFYEMGNLSEAANLLERAAIAAEADQTIVLHNQSLVKGELGELEQQRDLRPDLLYDEARMYFFQGDYTAVLRVLSDRGNRGVTAEDLAMMGIALAHKKRWPEADKVTVQLDKIHPPWIGDYVFEMLRIAFYQDFPDVAAGYLKVLEVLDRDHPGYAAGTAMLAIEQNRPVDAKSTLEQYLARMGASGRNVHAVRLLLYDIYNAEGNLAACQRLINEVQNGPLLDISDYTELADYYDLAGSLNDIAIDEGERLIAPDKPLDSFQFQEQ